MVAPQLPRHAMLLASIGDDIVGVGEFHVADDPEQAEVAFAVSDDQQGHGIATLLLEDLAVIAECVGLRRLVAKTLPGNTAMQLVFRTAGLVERHRFDDGLMDVVMDLTDHGGLRREAAEREAAAVAASLAPFFDPRHVVVFGDAPPGTAAARRIVEALGATFAGRLTVIDPAGGQGSRVRCVSDLDAVPDLAIIAGALADTMDALVECGSAGVRAAVVVSADAAAVTQRFGTLAEIARRFGMRIVGPTSGLVVPSRGLLATRVLCPLGPGAVGVVAQCDGVGEMLQHDVSRRGIGVSAFAALGPSDDVVAEDLFWWWLHDPATRVILADLDHEPVRHRYRRVARWVARSKPIVSLPRTDVGGNVAAGGALVDDALVDEDGVIHASDRTGMLDLGMYFAAAPAPVGRRLAFVFNGDASADAALLDRAARALDLVPTIVSPPSDDDATTDEATTAGFADRLIISDEVDLCLVRPRGHLVIHARGAECDVVRVALGAASWERGIAVAARAVQWSARAGGCDPLADELWIGADNTAEPLR